MKRILMFLVVNIAAVTMLTLAAAVVCSLCGGDVVQLAESGENFAPLLLFSFVFGMAGSLISLCLSKTIVKRTMKCRVIDGTEGDAERWLVQTVRSLAERAGVGMPEVAIYPGEANAFATGARRNHALVAVSTRIMEQMSRDELRAVLGHEMTHVANGDMVTMGLAQGVVNTFVIFFSHVLASVVQGALSGGKNNRRGRGGYGLYHILVQVFQMAAGVLAAVVLMWYSRRREYAADAGSAHLLGSPAPMIAALRRLGNLQPGILPESIKAFGINGGMKSIFASHPSMEDRINALMNLPPDYAV